jgi:L-threonylcarbamoyladenylate synthase
MQLSQSIWGDKNLINVLQKNGVAMMPTDTLYGIVGRAQNISVVERIFNLKKRALKKPCIILIGDFNELEKFSITLSEEQKNKLKEYWPAYADASAGKPGPTSIILDCPNESFSYLHRGTKTLAFRLPYLLELRALLLKVGPLIAPSANPEGLPPAEDIFKAKKYFGDLVDLYIDGGEIDGKHSRLVKLHNNGTVTIIRE